MPSAPYCRLCALFTGLVVGCAMGTPTAARAQTVLLSRVTLDDPSIQDQDDMCIWIHPTDRALSTIITSDKDASNLYVYDLQGNTLQVIPIAGTPGNIDVRYNFLLAGGPVDIVAVNNSTNRAIQVFRVDPQTRQLARVDNGAIGTEDSYGFCLYRSPASGTFFAFTTSETGNIGQYELHDAGGQVAATRVRSWDIGGQTEGCVCDDETALAYFGEEAVGIWKLGAEPSDPSAGALIARTGDASGLVADVEGLTIYYAAGGQGYVIASSQEISQFKVYQRQAPHGHVGTFTISGVTRTDGVDVTNVSLGPTFPFGIITVHNHTPAQKTVEVCAYEGAGLLIDTEYWDPRGRTPTDVRAGPAFSLSIANYPNPFSAATRIRYHLPSARRVELDVHDLMGRSITTRVIGEQGAGIHEVEWNGRDARGQRVPSGLYVIRLWAGSDTSTRKVVLTGR